MKSDLRPLGKIVRLQIQRSPLKVGEKPNRRYDPSALLAVDELTLTPDGALAVRGLAEGGTLLDVHHVGHPETRNNEGINDLSVGFTTHYTAMRERFGDHLEDGCAGENILIETLGLIELSALEGGLVIRSANGAPPIWLRDFRVAAPCRPFSGYVLNRMVDEATLKATLQFLDNGLRGFYCTLPDEKPATIAVGDEVLVPQTS
jgi:hypothetical protein